LLADAVSVCLELYFEILIKEPNIVIVQTYFIKVYCCKKDNESVDNTQILKACNKLTSWSRAHPEKLTVTQLVKKFLAIYGM
jgi:hypothetical protein